MMDILLDIIRTPVVMETICILFIAVLVKNKVVSEVDITKARKMLVDGTKTYGNITDATKLTIMDVRNIVGEKNSKKIQRGFRKILRGWF